MSGDPGAVVARPLQLAAISVLRHADPQALRRASALAAWRELPAGALVFDFDDCSADVYFLVRGGVRIEIVSPGGKELLFNDLGPGEHFGELAALDGGPRSARVTTLYPTLLAVLPGPAFRDLVAASPALSLTLLRQLTGRVRNLSSRLAEQSLLPLRERLMAELLRLSRLRNDGTRVISPPPRQQVLAARIGVRREAISREMAAMEREGLVVQGAGAVKLVDRDFLSADGNRA